MNIIEKFGYKFNRIIFQLAFLIIVAVVGTWAYINSWDLDYYSCAAGPLEVCKNPFYRESWKHQEYLSPGEYGLKPGWVFRLNLLIVFIIILAFIVNHLIHNKGKKPIRGVLEYAKNHYNGDD